MVSSRGALTAGMVRQADLWQQLSCAIAAIGGELKMLHLKNGVPSDHIWFADDIFALSPKWTYAFADAVAASKASVPFKMQSRCDLMTRETVGRCARLAARKCGWAQSPDRSEF